MKTAFVTGGTGFLGRHIIEQLIERNWAVTVLHRPESQTAILAELGVRLVQGSLADIRDLRSLIVEGTDAVFHVAGDTSFWSRNDERQYQTNVVGTRNLVSVALSRKVKRFVHTSTVGVYGFQSKLVTEKSPHLGLSAWIGYMKSKALAEEEVRAGIALGLDAVFMNPAAIVGPYDYHNWSRLIKMVYEDKLPGVPPGATTFCHARSVAKAHIDAVELGQTGENYILGGVHATQLEFVQQIARTVEKPLPEKAMPAILLKTLGRVSMWVSYLTGREPDLTPENAAIVCDRTQAATDKAVKELNYQPGDFKKMVEDCVEWMRKEKIL